LYAGRNIVRVQVRVKCFNVWVVIAVVIVVVVVVVDGIKICNGMFTTKAKHVFLIPVSC
jgi:hypothetical protein